MTWYQYWPNFSLQAKWSNHRIQSLFKVFYLVARRLGGSPVVLRVYRTRKVYNLVARRLVSRRHWRAAEPREWYFFKSGPVFFGLAAKWNIDTSLKLCRSISWWAAISFPPWWTDVKANWLLREVVQKWIRYDHVYSDCTSLSCKLNCFVQVDGNSYQ